ncbi:MAG: dipeptidase [Candidatus Omnitrophota bacterium]
MSEAKKVRMERLACTTIIVGKSATADGSVIVAHADDDINDGRVIFVPARKWDLNDEKEKFRNVYYDTCCDVPFDGYTSTYIRRYIGDDRGPGYQTQSEGYPASKPLGKIPQIAETYAYFDGNYGIMNEHNLMIGECTCGAKVQLEPEPGKRIFYSSELSRVALERCQTAQEAITLIAELIRDFGFYGTGETLLIGDSNEAWVFEMCAYDNDDPAGVWVAQRVPDDHFFVEANEFRIRDIYRSNEDINGVTVPEPYYVSKGSNRTVLYSKNLFAACKKNGWIEDHATHLDWLPTVSYGEYGHPYYSLRRVWRALSKVSPLSNLPSKVADGYTRDYPFSLVPGKKLSISDIASVYRDQYEGTKFDLTVGPGAGPFGCPVRYDVNADRGVDTWNLKVYKPTGAWERPISIYRCEMLWINQAKTINNHSIGISWIGLDRPMTSCLMPFYTQIPDLPKSIQTMNLLDFKFEGNSAWWAFNFVANHINLNYAYMIQDVTAKQKELESSAFDKINQVLATGDTNKLEAFCASNVESVLAAWWQLATALIVKYNDGCITTDATHIMETIDYPKNWLKLAGFYDGPVEY